MWGGAIMALKNIFGHSRQEYARMAGVSVEEWEEATKFRGTDLGWIIICIGSAIGAGIVFLPVQVGLVGLWVYMVAAIIGYPILYKQQKLYLGVLADSPQCQDFARVISGYRGKNWGFLLGIVYFLMATILVFLYSTALTNDSASFIRTFGLTDYLLSDNIFYGLAVVCVVVAIASQGEKLLMKVSSGMVFTKLIVLVILGLVMVQYWNTANVGGFPDIGYIAKNFFVVLPLVTMSIAFFGVLGPAVFSYRSKMDNKVVAHYQARRVMNLAYATLIIVVLFYTVSFNLSISHEQAVQAYTANISSLAMAAKNMDGTFVKILSLILNIFAVVTAYLAIFLVFRDSCIGIALNLLRRFISEERINRKAITGGVSIFCILICWGVIALNAPVLSFAALMGPIMGILVGLMPVCIILRKRDTFQQYFNWWLIPVTLLGLFLVLSPFISLG